MSPVPSLASARKFFQPQPRRLTQNSTKTREPKGMMLLDTRKSSTVWMSPTPGMTTSESTLKPSAQGRDKSGMAMRFTMTARLRDQPHWSMEKRRMPSNTAMTVESAAKLMNTKKSVPQTWPSHICSNTLGRVMNTRPGPESGATPKAKQAGKMMRPVASATPVSKAPMVAASPMSERCLSM